MTQEWSNDGTGTCQFCGGRVVCEGKHPDDSFRRGHEYRHYERRNCSICGRFRITLSAGAYPEIPEKTLRAISSWIIENQPTGPPEWSDPDLPLVRSDLINELLRRLTKG